MCLDGGIGGAVLQSMKCLLTPFCDQDHIDSKDEAFLFLL